MVLEFHLQLLVLELQGREVAAAHLMELEVTHQLVVQVKLAVVMADIILVVLLGRVKMLMPIQVQAAAEVLGTVLQSQAVMEAQA